MQQGINPILNGRAISNTNSKIAPIRGVKKIQRTRRLYDDIWPRVRTHYTFGDLFNTILDIHCSKISDKDTRCVCCKQPLKSVAKFQKQHFGCLDRMENELTDDIIGEAVEQRARIRETANKIVNETLRTAQDADSARYSCESGQNSTQELAATSSTAPTTSSGRGIYSTQAPQLSSHINNLPGLFTHTLY